MTGLIQRDLLISFRRLSKMSYIMEAVYFLFLLLFFNNIYGPLTFFLLATPINMSGLPNTMKEMDSNYRGMRSARLLPYSKKDIVRGRFLSAVCYQLFYILEMILFAVCHHFIKGGLSLQVYLLFIAGGWLAGLFLTAVNLLTSFTSGLNTSAIIYLITIVLLVGGYWAFIFLGSRTGISKQISSLNITWVLIIAVCFNILFWLVSYSISVKCFEKNAY